MSSLLDEVQADPIGRPVRAAGYPAALVSPAWSSEKPDKLRLPRCRVADEEFVTGLQIRLEELV